MKTNSYSKKIIALSVNEEKNVSIKNNFCERTNGRMKLLYLGLCIQYNTVFVTKEKCRDFTFAKMVSVNHRKLQV